MLLSLFLALNAMAASPSETYMSINEQNAYMEQKAKSIRREYYIGGYEDVESSTTFMDKIALDEYVKQADSYENFLDSKEVGQLYSCVARNNCELYLVKVGASQYGGSGSVAHFVMLYTASRKSYTLSHWIWAE